MGNEQWHIEMGAKHTVGKGIGRRWGGGTLQKRQGWIQGTVKGT